MVQKETNSQNRESNLLSPTKSQVVKFHTLNLESDGDFMKFWLAGFTLCLCVCLGSAQTSSKRNKTDQGLKDLLSGSQPRTKISLRYWDITDDGLKLLADQTQLVEITLGSGPSGKPSRLTDKGLAHLANLKNLQRVNLFFMDIDGSGFKDWKAKRIERLWSVATNIDDKSVPSIGKWTELRILAMHGRSISDESMKHLSGLQKLRLLRLSSQRMTDAGLAHLSKLKSLKNVTLYKSKVTAKGIAELQKSLPGCTVFNKYGSSSSSSKKSERRQPAPLPQGRMIIESRGNQEYCPQNIRFGPRITNCPSPR